MPWYYSETPLRTVGGGRPGHGLPRPPGTTDPGWGVEEGEHPIDPEWGWGGFPSRPGRPIYPVLPPREDWPELPDDIWDRLPIKPSPEHPMVPVPEEPEIGGGLPPGIWPPPRPEFPDLSGKTLALARVYVSRHVNYLAWVVIDHAQAKTAWDALVQRIKEKLPAGGVGGRPPARPGPAE